jgi:GTPase
MGCWLGKKMNNETSFKSGFVGILGAPNVGKSTLLNQLLGQKIAITSEKPQTTRHRILGVAHRPGAQLIFLDTPGIHQASTPLNIRMVDVALKVLGDVDVVVFMTDAASPDNVSDQIILQSVKKKSVPVILVINKIDLINKEALLPLIEHWRDAYPFRAVVPISALQGVQVDVLLSEMVAVLPEGPPYYTEESVTDLPERFIAAEMIREKVFRLTSREIPYGVAVTVESFKRRQEKDLVDVQATIHVERDSQKPIIIGKRGRMLKQIGEQARHDIEHLVGCKVFLKLWVRVQKKWTRDEKAIRRFGY